MSETIKTLTAENKKLKDQLWQLQATYENVVFIHGVAEAQLEDATKRLNAIREILDAPPVNRPDKPKELTEPGTGGYYGTAEQVPVKS